MLQSSPLSKAWQIWLDKTWAYTGSIESGRFDVLDDCYLDLLSLGQLWIHASLNHSCVAKERNPRTMLKSQHINEFSFSLNLLKHSIVSPELRVMSYTFHCSTKNLELSICCVMYTMESLYCFAEQQITGMKQQQT